MNDVGIGGLLSKLESIDSDLRIMALSDLQATVDSADDLSPSHLSAVTKAVVGRLTDANPEVQNQAVKCIEALVSLLSPSQMRSIVAQVVSGSESASASASESGSGDITHLALRTIVTTAPATPENARTLVSELLPVLLSQIQSSVDSMDVLADILRRFGGSLTTAESEACTSRLLSIVAAAKPISRKRAVVSLGVLASHLADNRWQSLCETALASVEGGGNDSHISLCGVLAREEPARFVPYLERAFNAVYSHLSLEDIDEEADEQETEKRRVSLVTLEAFTGIEGIATYLPQLVKAIQVFLQYDPNYLDDEDDDEDIDLDQGDAGQDEDDDEDDDFLSSDEDQSWKLRRHAAKLAAVVALTVPEWRSTVLSELLGLMVKRYFKEREDTVRVEVATTLAVFISGTNRTKSSPQQRRSSDVSMSVDPVDTVADKIVAVSLRVLSGRTSSPVLVHVVLDGVLMALAQSGRLGGQLPAIVQALLNLRVAQPSLTSEVVKLVDASVLNHSAELIAPVLGQLLEILVHGVWDSYYKVCGESLQAAQNLLEKMLRHENHSFPSQDMAALETALIARASEQGFDLATRRRAVRTLGLFLVAQKHNVNTVRAGEKVLLSLCSHEMLRQTVVEACVVLTAEQPSDGVAPDIDWVKQISALLYGFLRQSSRPLRMASVTLLRRLLDTDSDQTPVDSEACLTCARLAIAESDGAMVAELAPLFGQLLSGSAVSPAAITGLTVQFVESGLVPSSVLQLVARAVQTCDQALVTELYESLARLYSGPEDSAANVLVARAVATCLVYSSALSAQVAQYEALLESNSAVDDKVWPLLVLGEVGRLTDMHRVLPKLNAYIDRDEPIKTVAARAIGAVVSKSQGLAELLQKVASGDSVYLVALREVIWELSAVRAAIGDSQHEIWDTLFSLPLESFSQGSELALVSECVGLLSIAQPSLLARLQILLRDNQEAIRTVAVSALKFALAARHEDPINDESTDLLLEPLISQFPVLLQDASPTIRQNTLSTIVAALHHKPQLLNPHLPQLLPVLYNYTTVDPTRIRVVQMGPFKHRVDDGLEERKTAFEALYTVTLSADLVPGSLAELYDRVLVGLTDDHEIKVLSCVIVGRVAQTDVSVLVDAGLGRLISLFSAVLDTKVKDSAVKQEFEKQGEAERNIVRVAQQIDVALEEASVSDVDRTQWHKFYGALKT